MDGIFSLAVAGTDIQIAAAFHSFGSIDDHIDEHTLDLSGIDHGQGQVALIMFNNLDVVEQGLIFNQGNTFIYHFVDSAERFVRFSLASKVQ